MQRRTQLRCQRSLNDGQNCPSGAPRSGAAARPSSYKHCTMSSMECMEYMHRSLATSSLQIALIALMIYHKNAGMNKGSSPCMYASLGCRMLRAAPCPFCVNRVCESTRSHSSMHLLDSNLLMLLSIIVGRHGCCEALIWPDSRTPSFLVALIPYSGRSRSQKRH